MIYKQPSIYKQGLSVKDVQSIVKDMDEANYEWIDITNKLGNKITSGIVESAISFKYNKALGLIKCNAYAYFASSSSFIRKIFDFNQDIPGSGQGQTHVFNAEPLAYCGGNPSILGIIRFCPYYTSNADVSYGVSVDAKNYVEANGREITIINQAQIEAFNTYLGL